MEEIMKNLNYQPVYISETDLKNPLPAMTYFFTDHPLHECKAKMWELYSGWVQFATVSPDGEELRDMLFFYEQMEDMLNLCYLYTNKGEESKQTPL